MKNRYFGIIWLMWCMVLLVFGVLGNRGVSAAVDSYTKLLIHGDSIGDATGKTVTAYGDAAVSNAGKTVTANGNAQIDTAQSKFDVTSGLFDGNGDYLSLADSDDWNLGGDFTIDFWIRLNDTTSSMVIVGQQETGDFWEFILDFDSLVGAKFRAYVGGWVVNFSQGSNSGWSTNTWYHVAVVRFGNSYNIYRNGISIANITSSNGTVNLNSPLYIGNAMTSNFTRSGNYFNGWIDEFRISKGIARWTSNFTPPTEAYTSNNCTKLLLHFNGSDGSASFIDSSRDHFKGKAISFDGSGDYLSLADSDDWNFGTGDFTIDFWVRFNSVSGEQALYKQYDSGNTYNILYKNSAGVLVFQSNSGGVLKGYYTYSAWAPSVNTWYHVAVVRSGSNGYLFIDGVSVGAAINPFDSNILPNLAAGVKIGTWSGAGGPWDLNGWLDELRISKGTARWTSDFCPPTAPYGEEDTTPPTVSSTSPASNATGVAVDSEISATFSEAMDFSTINTSTFTLSDSDGNNISGTVSFSCCSETATFAPSSNLAYSTTYTAKITTGAKDMGENPLISDYLWTFTTVSDPNTLPQCYQFVTKWGSQGTGDGQFDGPWGVTVDSSGNIYVVDHKNHRVQKFSSDGTFITQWGSFGMGDGQFKAPWGVAVDISENVYVADADNHRIQKFDSNGTFITKWGANGSGDGQFNSPTGVTVDASENVYITDYLNNRIQKFNSSGTFITKWGSSGTGDGQFNFPFGVAVDVSGNVYVVDDYNNRIQKFSSSGTFITKWGSFGTGDGQLDRPHGVAVDASGNIYVTDRNNNRVQKFSSSGTFITKWGSYGSEDGQLNSPGGVVVDASGNVYVADFDNNRIQKFSLFPCPEPTPTPTPDTPLPTVTSTSPAGGATDVAIDTAITVTFSELMDASTINDTTFIVSDGTNTVSGTITHNDTTATFTPSSNLDYSTTYTVTITTGVKDLGGNAMTSDFTWSFTTGEDPQPVANAGDDQTVNEDELVSLQGSGAAPQGVTLTYQWTQVAGPNVIISDTNSPTPTFTAPQVNANVTLTFQLTVSYDTYSSSDTVDITIVNVNHAPVAYTGDDQTVDEGTLVTLHGETSYDPDASEITYQWTQVRGQTVTLSGSNSANPTFTAPSVAAATLLEFELVVNDGELSSDPAVAKVTVEHVNHASIADTTGSTQTVDEETQVTLDGSQSSDPDGDSITYQWTQVSGPTVTLSDMNSANPSFTAPQVTDTTYFEFKLAVNDGQRSSEPAYATVTVLDTNQPIDCSSATPSTATLWPPNHKLVSVSIEGVTDPDNEEVTITITGVTQDEPVDGLGDGDTTPDAVIQGDTVLLRAERSGTGDGRVYEVHFTADDGQGSTCEGSVRVSVPHDKKKTENATDSGQNYDSTQQ